jgi:hypothetical protein
MLFAVLEFGDFAVIALLILVFAGGRAAASAYLWPADRDRLRRLEHRLDLILTHLGIDYVPPPKFGWQELADDPGRKISAIKAYREQHGVGLAEAKKAVEDYTQGNNA